MADRLAGLAFVIFGVLVAVRAGGLGVGGWRTPGPGFLPLVVGVAASLLGAGLALSRTPQDLSEDGRRPTSGRLFAPGLLLAAYALGLERLGFVPATFVFILAWLRVVERSPWSQVALMAAGTTAVLYGIFIRWLAIPLPAGIFAP